ncbi:MAG: 3-oxoacyl-[acyl-carrier-protein] reductase [Actinomycetota bacterium]
MSEVALVTGGSRGIGRAIAEALAADGFTVAVNFLGNEGAAKDTVEAIESAGGEAITLQADVADSEQVDAMFTEVEERLGPVVALVNNAGVRADGLALGMKDDAWHKVIQTNLFGTFACTRRALRPMLRARKGRIVNITSISGMHASPGQANYSAAKAGVIGLTKTVAAEVAGKGIAVNAVAPGLIATDLTANLNDKQVEAIQGRVPAKRIGTPEDVASLVSWLCSERASYITGSLLTVDGGLTA